MKANVCQKHPEREDTTYKRCFEVHITPGVSQVIGRDLACKILPQSHRPLLLNPSQENVPQYIAYNPDFSPR
ncbi:hypothetical protein Q8A67_021023 [Cirrhinus molitorella]|uniref:Uncharacterized protein n=1 Tax=Cirrhinus molitorella TaxID=172907 RepID=A0AA88P8U8_9TELE|nr:hypothetical protein Q8A67_021023 [Cirrhinus molitorella]